MFGSYFSFTHQILLLLTFLFILIGFIHQKKTEIWWFLSVFIFKVFYLTLHNVLFVWDEQFHALVARSMTRDFLLPVLYPDNPLDVPADTHWTSDHFWFHKQPFFLWLMAFSIKFFDTNPFAVKFPSFLFSLLSVFFLRKALRNIITNRWIINLTCLAYGLNPLLNDTMIGFEATDHNDSIFLSLLIFAFWAYTEYQQKSDKKISVMFIGLFSGLAMLTKWLLGLYVFGIWLLQIFILFVEKQSHYKIQFKHIMLSLLILFFIFLPWQIFVFVRFPDHFMKELYFNFSHFTLILEGHEGDVTYYLGIIFNYILNKSDVFVIPLLFGLFTLRFYFKDIFIFYACLGISLFVLIFFTIAKTKMPNFTSMNMPFYYAAIFSFLVYLYENFKDKFQHAFIYSFIFILLYYTINPEGLQSRHTYWLKNSEYANKLKIAYSAKANAFKVLKFGVDKKTVFFNFSNFSHIGFMFYTGLTAYPFLPDEKIIQKLKERKYHAVILDYDGTLDTLGKKLNVEILRIN